MKKEVFKVFVLGIIGLTLFTGCNKKESVKKLKKNEEVINYEEQLKISENESYSVEYYKFKNQDSLLKEYNSFIESLTSYSIEEQKNVDVITKEDNIYEGMHMPNKDDEENLFYRYILLIKNDKELIVIFQASENEDKTYIKEIGNKIKNEAEFNNDYRKVFEDYAEENNLTVTSSNDLDAIENCEVALNAAKSDVVIYSGSNRKVETVDFDGIELTADKFKIIAVAKNSDDQIIWSFDVGFVPKFSSAPEISIKKGDKYVYATIIDTLEIRDIQTGKIIHSVKLDVEAPYLEMIEYKDKLFLVKGGHVDCDTLYVIDIKNGKVLYKNNNFNVASITNLNNDNYSIGIDFENVKKEDNKIYCDVYENEPKKIIGTVTIDYNDYSVKYNKK